MGRKEEPEPRVTDAYADWGAHRLSPRARGWPWPSATEKTWRKQAIFELIVGVFIGLCCAPLIVLLATQQFNRYVPPTLGQVLSLVALALLLLGYPAACLISGIRAFVRHRPAAGGKRR